MAEEKKDPLEFDSEELEGKKEEIEDEEIENGDDGSKGEIVSLELNDDSENSQTDVNISTLYDYLSETEILDKGQEIKNIEDLEKAFRKREDTAVDRYKEELPEELKSRIEAFEKGIPYEETMKADKSINTLKSITDDMIKDKEFSKKIIKMYLEEQGDSDEYIEDHLTLLEDTDRLYKEGLRSRNALLKINEGKAKQKELEKLKEVEEIKKSTNEYVNSLVSYIDDSKSFWGIEIPKDTKKKVKEAILEPSKISKDKRISLDEAMKKDASILPQIQLLYEMNVFGEKGNLDFLIKPAKSKAVLDVNEILNNKEGGTSAKYNKVNTEITVGFLDSIRNKLQGR